MTHIRNTQGLVKAAQQRRLETIARVNKAIQSLKQNNETITFNRVAKIAQVGKPWLYKEAAVRQQIETLRMQTKHVAQTAKGQSTSDKSSQQINLMLKARIHKLEGENKALKAQIEMLYGQLLNRSELN
jgi:hypothetical protein